MSLRSLIFAAVLFVAFIQSIESSVESPIISFDKIGCKGEFDSAGWAKIDRIIETCHNLYHSVEFYNLSR